MQRRGVREELAFWRGAEKARGTEAQRTGAATLQQGEFAEAGSRPCKPWGIIPGDLGSLQILD